MISCLGSHAMRRQKCSTMPSPHATVIRTIFRWMILIVLVTFPLVSWRKTILSWINSSIQAHVLLQMPASCPETLYVLVRWVRYLASSAHTNLLPLASIFPTSLAVNMHLNYWDVTIKFPRLFLSIRFLSVQLQLDERSCGQACMKSPVFLPTKWATWTEREQGSMGFLSCLLCALEIFVLLWSV